MGNRIAHDPAGEARRSQTFVIVYRADIQDRDGTFQVLRQARRLFPFIERIFADRGYRGDKMGRVVSRTGVRRLEIVIRFCFRAKALKLMF